MKFVAIFLGRVHKPDVTLSWEHDRHAWLPYDEAHERITLPQMKTVLEKAEQFLEESTRK